MTTGDVELTILDGGGAVVVPLASVQVVMGTCSSGSTAQVVATRNPNTLVNVFGYGPMVEAAAMTIAAGGTALCLKTASNTPGASSTVAPFNATGAGAATGTSVVTVTGVPYDTYYAKLLIVAGGTRGTAGITFKISLDGGRSYGPTIALGTALTYNIPNTGATLNFGVGTLVAGEYYLFKTTEPLWNTAGVQACMNALQASAYAITGWGSMHIVGDMSGSNCTTLQGFLQTWQTGKIYSRAITSVRDASPAVATWTGSGETEAAWMSAVLTDYGSTAAKRVCVCAGHYNMSSKIPTSVCGLPKYRRPLSFALASRQVQIPAQRHAGRVKDGSLTEIVTDPAGDAVDGFVYHDERLNPGFDGAKFCSVTTRIKKKGWWIKNPNLMSDTGSVFTLLPLGQVMDIACDIVNATGTEDINEDIRLNRNGTIFENEAIAIEKRMGQALKDNMLSKNMISDFTVVVDRSVNVSTTSTVKVTVTIFARGYVLEEDIVIGFGQSAAAA